MDRKHRESQNIGSIHRGGQRVAVVGEVDWYQGDPAIYVTTPEQIWTVDAAWWGPTQGGP